MVDFIVKLKNLKAVAEMVGRQVCLLLVLGLNLLCFHRGDVRIVQESVCLKDQ